ncbi:uncharacterized protein MYCFIDRAFT_179564 [Pseudocercospora fijiensis CIRAD86]|uniref:Uncharacterized protein n=1 Tax=Pseudocercospora fijiensis (strain CIRAD86) TaxID=383855 RepID=M3ALU2_PSEFD|nr:uncharacterized protein MYCFIDRAFT_179564 [Pseudocercospora fijiensis CIRAD86]EME78118.1 hypothetical protein MYCFIDRAFT_179564 [Pseudocercospora fijiensis CIRAD86]
MCPDYQEAATLVNEDILSKCWQWQLNGADEGSVTVTSSTDCAMTVSRVTRVTTDALSPWSAACAMLKGRFFAAQFHVIRLCRGKSSRYGKIWAAAVLGMLTPACVSLQYKRPIPSWEQCVYNIQMAKKKRGSVGSLWNLAGAKRKTAKESAFLFSAPAKIRDQPKGKRNEKHQMRIVKKSFY